METHLSGLLERVENATEETQGLVFYEVASTLITTDLGSADFYARFLELMDARAYTDVALALVERKLPGERVAFEKFPDHGFCVVMPNSGDESEAEAATLPLAILAALLRALSHTRRES